MSMSMAVWRSVRTCVRSIQWADPIVIFEKDELMRAWCCCLSLKTRLLVCQIEKTPRLQKESRRVRFHPPRSIFRAQDNHKTSKKTTAVYRYHNRRDTPHLTELCSKMGTRKFWARQLCCRSQRKYAPHHEPKIFVLEEVDRLEERVLCNP